MASDPIDAAMSMAAGGYAPQSVDPVGDAMEAAAAGHSQHAQFVDKGKFSFGQAALAYGTGALAQVGAGYRGLWDIATGQGFGKAASDVSDTQSRFTMDTNERTAEVMQSNKNPLNWIPAASSKAGEFVAEKTGSPALGALIDTAGNAFGMELGVKGLGVASDALKAGTRATGTAVRATRDFLSPPKDAQTIADTAAASSPQSMGAAASAPNLANVSLPLKQAVVDAARKNAGAINPDALANHAEAEQHGVHLMEGQATRDPITFSNEQNSTNPAIVKRRQTQEQEMTDAIDDIRQQAGPTTVHNDPIQNGQIVVDALKTYDKPIVNDINSSYQAARDASAHGDLQMDGSSFVDQANALLKPQSKFRYLPSAVQGILDDVKEAGGKMSLDDYQAYETQLGNEIARAKASKDGNAAFAIGKVKEALGNIQPIGEETARAKELFDVARSKAKARFDALDADPAYEAAVDDSVKIGAPSPLADKFLDKYALGAPKANLDLLMQKLDPEATQAVASHTLSAIRNSAVTANGKVSPNGYNSAMQKYSPKLSSLVDQPTIDSLESLGRVITNAKVPPEGHFVNYSKSGVLRNAATGVAQEIGGAALNAKTFGMGVPVVQGIAERAFAKRVLAPGAGIEKLSEPIQQRGGASKP